MGDDVTPLTALLPVCFNIYNVILKKQDYKREICKVVSFHNTSKIISKREKKGKKKKEIMLHRKNQLRTIIRGF